MAASGKSSLGSALIVKHKLTESILNWIQILCDKKLKNETSQILVGSFCHIAWNFKNQHETRTAVTTVRQNMEICETVFDYL